MILLPNDLKVTIRSSCLVYPSLPLQLQETNKSFFLSNIDQVVNFDVQTVHFFRAYGEGESLFPIQVVAEKLKSALENVLVSYDFLGGRLTTNPLTGRLEIDCNRAGAGFVVANSDLSLDEIGDLVYPNPAFGQLAIQTLDNIDHKPLCIVQVTSFKCCGFVIGISNNHATFDGISFKAFLENLAALACGEPLAVTPCHDRHLLAARSPPRVTFPHPELVKLMTTSHPHQDQDSSSSPSSNPPILLNTTQETLAFHVFRLTSSDLAALKNKASRGGGMEARVSEFNAITAHIWRCKALSCDASNADADRLSMVVFAVDVRPRLTPPLPASYAGNAVLMSYATATCRELEEGPLSRLAEMVKEGAKRMTNEYARSVIDWGEMNKGYPQGELLVSSWLKLGFDEVEYPWGRPTYSCPVVSPRKDLVLLFPDIDDKDGVNILVSLPSNQMDKFQTLFRMLL